MVMEYLTKMDYIPYIQTVITMEPTCISALQTINLVTENRDSDTRTWLYVIM